MVFNSLTFLVFFGLVFAFHWSTLPWRVKKGYLLLASYFFYAVWNPPFVVLIWLSTLVDWFVAKAIHRATRRRVKRAYLVISLMTNLGLLAFFKYGNFVLDNFVALLGTVGVVYRPAELDIILPVGISFYTFQTLSYTIDVYRGDLEPSRSFLDYALYVTFFPQLVAGPIVRARDFLPQCKDEPEFRSTEIKWGVVLFIVGLFEKMVLADTLLAPVSDDVYGAAAAVTMIDAWIGTLAFSGQIFFDFAGYSTCAIGAGLMLGFELPVNFRFPYAAKGFSDFWRRWHVSLSTWLRDYVYIPLGGNRKGSARTQINLMVTMLLGGLWHGAAWNFVLWGGLHGGYLIAERWLRRWFGREEDRTGLMGSVAHVLVTYVLTCIAWVFFRATTIGESFQLLGSMVKGAPELSQVGGLRTLVVLGVTTAMLIVHYALRNRGLADVWVRTPWFARGAALAVMLLAILLAPGGDRAFIYFQF